MALVAAVLLAIFVLPQAWDIAAVATGAAIEVGESLFWVRWSRRRKAQVGAETLVGAEAEVRDGGYVFVQGELWRATGAEGLERGSRVRVLAVDGLTLLVEPAN
jgi:membrane protein implicated in regulation of membrane protease activity